MDNKVKPGTQSNKGSAPLHPLLLFQLCSVLDELQLLPVLQHTWRQEFCQVCCTLQQLPALLGDDSLTPCFLGTPASTQGVKGRKVRRHGMCPEVLANSCCCCCGESFHAWHAQTEAHAGRTPGLCLQDTGALVGLSDGRAWQHDTRAAHVLY